jgi:branched-chain amino acid transport system ATP-binding protein
MTSEESLLRVSGIDVHYGSFQALWNVSLEVRKGEVVSIIGANSAGKSTLLNSISGVNAPSKGSITFEGKDITGQTAARIVELGISQVPEGRRIFPSLTVLENLELGSYPRKARPKRKNLLKKVYELFPVLEERSSQAAGTLSGGEQQMLAIGRALMSDPQIILFDEISLGLAPVLVDKIYKRVDEINEEGMTVLLVEQNVRRCLKEADRAYIMKTGRIVLSGTPDELKEEEEIKKAYFGI